MSNILLIMSLWDTKAVNTVTGRPVERRYVHADHNSCWVRISSSPVHGDALASGEVDLMDDSTAGNREMVTVNTRNTLTAYTQI